MLHQAKAETIFKLKNDEGKLRYSKNNLELRADKSYKQLSRPVGGQGKQLTGQ